MIYKWLVEVGKAISYYNENVYPKKEQHVPITSRPNVENKGVSNELQKEIGKLKDTLKKKEKIIEELKGDNQTLKNENEKLKTDLKQFQDQFLVLMKLLENTMSDDKLKPGEQQKL